MRAIIFESSAEEAQQTATPGTLELFGSRDLLLLRAEDILWIVTRADERGTPGLCGRLIVESVGPNPLPGGAGTPGEFADRTHRLSSRAIHRSAAIPCPWIASWNFWRQPFKGVGVLTRGQGTMLEAEWTRAQTA